MNLERGLQVELQVLIQNHLGAIPDMATLRTLVGAEAVEGLPRGASTTPALARWVISVALRSPGPDTLVRIVEMVDAGEELTELRLLLATVAADPSRWQSTGLDELWVPPKWPFIDRDDLRRVITDAARGQGPPALLMEAPTGYGKRTMCAYLELVMRRSEQFTTVARHLHPDDPVPGMLDAIDADLRIELGASPSEGSRHAEPEREAVNRAAELAEAAMLAGDSVWFVVNLIDPARLDASVLKFVDELLGRVQGSTLVSDHLRMVVLTADASQLDFRHLPGLEARYVMPDLTADSITAWLAAASPDKPEKLYQVLTARVLADLDARRSRGELPASRQLEWLSRHCRVAHQKLEAFGA